MLQSSEDIADLLKLISVGDKSAFAKLYNATNLKIFGICLRICRQRELAEEVLQEVYLKIWHHAGDFQENRASPITWMAIIARNRALDEVRKKHPVLAEGPVAVEDFSDPSKTPEEQVEFGEDLKKLEICLAKLDPEKSEAVLLAYLDGYSRPELAEKYGQPLGTVKSWLHRSLKQLKDCLQS